MKFFRSPVAAQRFLAVFSAISPHFRPGRHKLTASDYRSEMTDRFATMTSLAYPTPENRFPPIVSAPTIPEYC